MYKLCKVSLVVLLDTLRLEENTTMGGLELNALKSAGRTEAAKAIAEARAQGDLSDESYREVIRIAVRNAAGDLESPNVQENLQRLNEQD